MIVYVIIIKKNIKVCCLQSILLINDSLVLIFGIFFAGRRFIKKVVIKLLYLTLISIFVVNKDRNIEKNNRIIISFAIDI